MLPLRYFLSIMDQKQMCGQQGSYCTYYLVECHHFGQVCIRAMLLQNRKNLALSLQRTEVFHVWSLETQQGIFDAVLKGHIDFESDPWPVLSDSAKDLIRKMLCSQPSGRLTAHEVLCMYNLPILF